MRALRIEGSWLPALQSVLCRWRIEELQTDRFIYVTGLRREGRGLTPDPRVRLFCDLRGNMQNPDGESLLLNIGDVSGVSERCFCAFSASVPGAWNEAELQSLCASGRCYPASVVVGSAKVSYSIKATGVGQARLTAITLHSDADIAQGVLGYKFECSNMTMLHPFPSAITPGENRFPPILIPASGGGAEVVPLENRFTANVALTRKKPLFRF